MSKQSLTDEEREKLFAEMRSYLEPPKIRPLCSHLELRPSGTQYIKPFFGMDERYEAIIAPVSVWTMALRPRKSEDLDELRRHVTHAVEKLASIEPEFLCPTDRHVMRTGYAYERPYKGTLYGMECVNNAYVRTEDGEVIVAAPMLLSDALHVYEALKGVIIPSQSIAATFEHARWWEIRGPIAQLDDAANRYSFMAPIPENRLGMFEGVAGGQLLPEAKRHMAVLRATEQSTNEETLQQAIALAAMTAYGQLPDPNKKYPALTDMNTEGKTPEQIIGERAQDIVQDVLEIMEQSPGALVGKAFEAAAQTHGPSLRNALEEARHAESDESFARVQARREESQQQYKGRGIFAPHREMEMLRRISDAFSGKTAERKPDEESRDLATISNLAHAGPEIPFFIPRTYAIPNEDGQMCYYTTRPPGHACPPAHDLPADLEPFVEKREAGASPKAIQRLLAPT